MRKIYLIATLAIMLTSIFSCSKDTPASETVSGIYTGENLIVYNGTEESATTLCKSGIIEILPINDNSVKLNLGFIVSGLPSLEMVGSVEEVNGTFKITGTQSVNGVISVDFKGTLENNKLKANVTNEILATNIINTWTYNNVNQTMNFSNFELQNSTGKVFMSSMGDQEVSVEQFNETVNTWINLIGGMGLQTPQLSLSKNGYVSFKGITTFMLGATEPTEINFPNITKYIYNPATKQLIFEVPLSSFMSKAQPAQSPIIYLPFTCSFEGEVMTAILDPQFAAMLKNLIPTGASLEALLSQLDGLVPPDFAFFLPTIKKLITDVANAVTADNVISLKIGGNLQPYKAN